MNTTKTNTIIYRISTIWLVAGMLSGGLAQIAHLKWNVDGIVHLGYPIYFLYIIGTWKILGVVALLTPKLALLKEWAYAGFFFAMSGAVTSHIVSGDSIGQWAAPLSFLFTTVLSWYFRPPGKKIIPTAKTLAPTA